jgi:AcrR family transcriptional regulator
VSIPPVPDEPRDGGRREDLLAAAARRFVSVGIRKTTMEDIAREARAGKATLYRHFSNKDDLIDALLVREAARFQRRLARAAEGADGVLAAIQAAFVAGVRYFIEHPVLTKGRDEEPALLLERVTAQRGPMVETGLDWFAGLIEQGIAAGEVREVDPRAAAEVIMRLILSYFTFPPMVIRMENDAEAQGLARALVAGGLRPDRHPAGI